MYKFSERSLDRLKDCQPDLQLLMYEAIKYIDFSIVCSYRDKEDQEESFRKGFSKAHFGFSKHNYFPSRAVDIVPYPTLYSNEQNQILLAGIVKGLAYKMGIDIRWGGDWNETNRIDDDKGLRDFPHFELLKI